MKHLSFAFLLIFLFFLIRNWPRVLKIKNKEIKNSMLLIAHPDDESMFFSPFLYHNSPLVVCLSSGNYDGKGEVRKMELRSLCDKRNLKLYILDYKDGYNFDIKGIFIDISKIIIENNINSIVTFDSKGVSGHKNHISCFKAVKALEKMLNNKSLNFYYLKTLGIFEKYILMLQQPNYCIKLSSFFSIENMTFHKSQLVWFRYIYIIISNYMNFIILERSV